MLRLGTPAWFGVLWRGCWGDWGGSMVVVVVDRRAVGRGQEQRPGLGEEEEEAVERGIMGQEGGFLDWALGMGDSKFLLAIGGVVVGFERCRIFDGEILPKVLFLELCMEGDGVCVLYAGLRRKVQKARDGLKSRDLTRMAVVITIRQYRLQHHKHLSPRCYRTFYPRSIPNRRLRNACFSNTHVPYNRVPSSPQLPLVPMLRPGQIERF